MFVRFNKYTGQVEVEWFMSVGGQSAEDNGSGFDAAGGGGGTAPDNTNSDEGMSPFDQALNRLEERSTYPEQRATPAAPTEQLLPSDPRYKAQQRGQQAPATPSQTTTPVTPPQPTATAPAQPQQPRPNTPPQFLRADPQGNLVDENGNVVARAGGERKYYQNWRNSERALNEARTRQQTLEAENNAFRTSASAINALGLDPREMSAAANLMSNWKKDPVGVVRYLLTQAQALGHDVSALVGGQAGLDPAAIREMVRTEIAPLTERQRAEQVAAEARAASETEFNDFVQEFPEALTHADSLANMLRSFPQLSPREALFRLQAWTFQNGYDWNQPLAPQVQSRQDGGNGTASTAPTQPTRTVSNRSPVPGVTPPNGQMTDMRRPNGAATPAGASNRDVVAAAMVAAGLPDPRA